MWQIVRIAYFCIDGVCICMICQIWRIRHLCVFGVWPGIMHSSREIRLLYVCGVCARIMHQISHIWICLILVYVLDWCNKIHKCCIYVCFVYMLELYMEFSKSSPNPSQILSKSCPRIILKIWEIGVLYVFDICARIMHQITHIWICVILAYVLN